MSELLGWKCRQKLCGYCEDKILTEGKCWFANSFWIANSSPVRLKRLFLRVNLLIVLLHHLDLTE